MAEIIVQEVTRVEVKDLLNGGHEESIYFTPNYFDFLDMQGDLRFLVAKTKSQNVALMQVYYEQDYIPVSRAPWTLITHLGKFSTLNMLGAIKAFKSKLKVESVIHFPSLKFSDIGVLAISSFPNAKARLTSVVDLRDYTFRRDFRRKMKSSKGHSLKFESMVYDRQLYDCLAENRAALDATLSLSYSELESLLNVVPSSLYAVKQNENILASAVVLHLKENYSYVLYWGDIPDYRALNPMAFLVSNIYDELYLNNNIYYLELGTSYDDDGLQLGLFNFKESIGASPDLRIIL
jgi:hypothetical protein